MHPSTRRRCVAGLFGFAGKTSGRAFQGRRGSASLLRGGAGDDDPLAKMI